MSITEERYARATRSSHLEVNAEQRGDIDPIIAAGSADTLGVILARVRAEWDSQASELALYQRAQADQIRLAREARERAEQCAEAAEKAKTADEKNALCAESLEQFSAARFHAEQAEREGITGRAMVMMNMPTLPVAKQVLLTFGVKQAAIKRIEYGESADLLQMLGNTLDVWVDRNCHHCAGRGFNGGYRQPQAHCKTCRGTGSRRKGQLHSNPNLHGFGLWLLNAMDSKANGAMGEINRKTR